MKLLILAGFLATISANVFAGSVSISGEQANQIFNQMAKKQPRELETSEAGIVRTLGHHKSGVVITCIGEAKSNVKEASCEVHVFDASGK